MEGLFFIWCTPPSLALHVLWCCFLLSLSQCGMSDFTHLAAPPLNTSTAAVESRSHMLGWCDDETQNTAWITILNYMWQKQDDNFRIKHDVMTLPCQSRKCFFCLDCRQYRCCLSEQCLTLLLHAWNQVMQCCHASPKIQWNHVTRNSTLDIKVDRIMISYSTYSNVTQQIRPTITATFEKHGVHFCEKCIWGCCFTSAAMFDVMGLVLCWTALHLFT